MRTEGNKKGVLYSIEGHEKRVLHVISKLTSFGNCFSEINLF